MRGRINAVLNVFRTFSPSIEQRPVMTVLKPPVRVSLRFFSREVSLRCSLHICFIIDFYPDGDVRRTSYARTSNAVRTYTERRTSPLSPDGNAETMFSSHGQGVFSCA